MRLQWFAASPPPAPAGRTSFGLFELARRLAAPGALAVLDLPLLALAVVGSAILCSGCRAGSADSGGPAGPAMVLRPPERPQTPPEWNRAGHCAVAIGPRIYIIGGIAVDTGRVTARVDCLDTRLGQWSRVADMPTPRAFAAAAAVADRIYVLGGMSAEDERASRSTGAVDCYDPAADAWSPRAPMPTPRSRLAGAALDGRLFALGGLVHSAKRGSQNSAVVEEYDPLSDAWRLMPPLRTARHGHAACVSGGRLWVLGGYGRRPEPMRDVESMSTRWNTWRPEPPMLTARAWFGAVGQRDAVVAMGGGITPEQLSPGAKAWSPLGPADAPGRRMAVATVGGLIYVFGGEGEELDRAAKFVRIYDPALQRWVD